MGIVEGRPEQLAARQILVGRRNAALDLHRAGVERPGIAETRQRRAIGAQEEDRLDHVAARLADGKGGKRTVVERGFGHDAVNGERQLRDDLLDADRRQRTVAAAAIGQQAVGVGDGGFAAFDGNIHRQISVSMILVVRGRHMKSVPAVSTRSTPRGKSARLSFQRRSTLSARPERSDRPYALDPGA